MEKKILGSSAILALKYGQKILGSSVLSPTICSGWYFSYLGFEYHQISSGTQVLTEFPSKIQKQSRRFWADENLVGKIQGMLLNSLIVSTPVIPADHNSSRISLIRKVSSSSETPELLFCQKNIIYGWIRFGMELFAIKSSGFEVSYHDRQIIVTVENRNVSISRQSGPFWSIWNE